MSGYEVMATGAPAQGLPLWAFSQQQHHHASRLKELGMLGSPAHLHLRPRRQPSLALIAVSVMRRHIMKGEPALARRQLEGALVIFRRLGARKDAEQSMQALTSMALYQTRPPASVLQSDDDWARIQAVLPPPSRRGRPRADDRRTLEAILYVHQTGCAWNQLPIALGDGVTAFRRFGQWRSAGTWELICRILGDGAATSQAYA